MVLIYFQGKDYSALLQNLPENSKIGNTSQLI